ncbi:hypothetical protein [Micromonospora sp. NPDC047134]|uniref:hypothetical protein n=1 Tax=Micromonospora sp. NPDC047134 TaxID=3154340 RepID=UPI0033E986BE
MASDRESGPGLESVRRHHLAQVNRVLRRPGMYGGSEIAERLLLEAMAAVDARLPQWWAACEELREREAFASTGVVGAYGGILPVGSLRDATASVYAEIAHRFGWLELDRALSEVEFHKMSTDIGGWVTQDRTMAEVIVPHRV